MKSQPPNSATPAQTDSAPLDEAAERELFELLHRYTESLQRRDEAACLHLLRDHPELATWLPCLAELENLAPPAPRSEEIEFAKTVIYSGQTPEVDVSEAANSTSTLFSSGSSLIDGPLPFGKYELLEEIGRGGMGVVYKARQTDLNRTVALKMILASQFASREEVRRFYAEARAAGSLKHPHIVGIHEAGHLHGQHYFAMDFIDGPNLSEHLRQNELSPTQSVELLLPIVRAVAFLHQHEIVHRDLKPSNILLDETGHPFVTDLGLAKVFHGDGERTASGTIIGTPSYMSPEQAAGRTAEVGPRSDVYSLGAILYEMLTGRPPFREETPLDTLVQVLEGEPQPPTRLNPRIPKSVECICLRALEKAPERRYACAEDLAADLERFLNEEPIEAQPAGALEKLARWARREPALATRLGGVLSAAAIVQLFYFIDPVEWSEHWPVMLVFGIWLISACIFRWLAQRDPHPLIVRFAWAAVDSVLLTAVLALAEGPVGPLLIGYPLLVVAAGLFFRVRLVWFMTIVTLLSYACLLLIRPEVIRPLRYPLIFAAAQAILGMVVAYQVHRVRALSRYYSSRRG